MGAAATPLAFGEIYTALQAGVLDGLEHDPPTIVASKFYETAKFYSLTEHNFSALGVFCSGLTLAKMDAPLRDQFLAAAAEAAADTRVRGLEAEKEALDSLKQKGRRNHRLRSRAVPQAGAAADRRIHQSASGGEADHRYRPQHQGVTG
jgi:TRAP-type C4-dicarboxylate transport system substrate-binding protein